MAGRVQKFRDEVNMIRGVTAFLEKLEKKQETLDSKVKHVSVQTSLRS
jgi:hypothetical protein